LYEATALVAVQHKATLRWGVAFIAAAAVGALFFAFHLITWNREFTLLDQPMSVVANRMTTNTFTIPANAPYEINISVQAKVPYADCLLGQGGYLEERCSPYQRIIDVGWLVKNADGNILGEGVSGGTCCDYTADEVFTTLGNFKLPANTKAYLELKFRRDVSKLKNLAPRIVVQRSDAESELGLEIWSYLGIGVLLLISLVLFIAARLQYRALRASKS
jgi:hypothetical protein